MKKIILRFNENQPGGEVVEAQLSGLKIFVAAFCQEHNVAAIVAYRAQDGLNVACAMERLEAAARHIADMANAQGETPLEN